MAGMLIGLRSANRLASGASRGGRDFHQDCRYRRGFDENRFHVKEDDARNPGVIADCTGDNAGDSVGPQPMDLRLRRHRRGADFVHSACRSGASPRSRKRIRQTASLDFRDATGHGDRQRTGICH